MDKNTIKEPKEISHPVDLNGELISIQEIEKRYFQGIKYRQEKWLNKACEWFKEELQTLPDNNGRDIVFFNYNNAYDLIESFRKAMEE